MSQPVEAAQQITAGLLACQGIALAQQHRQGAGQIELPQRYAQQQQLGQARVQSQLGQPLTMDVQSSLRVEGAELLQALAGLLQGGRSGRVEPGQVCPQGIAPLGQLQSQGKGIDLQQLRRVVGGAPLLFGGRPQAQAAAGAEAAGPAGPLLGAGLASGHGHQSVEATAGIEAGAATQAAVDHQGDAREGKGALGDGGRQHHLACRLAGRPDRATLGGQGQVSV